MPHQCYMQQQRQIVVLLAGNIQPGKLLQCYGATSLQQTCIAEHSRHGSVCHLSIEQHGFAPAQD